MKKIIIVGEPTQHKKYEGGPRLIHTLLIKYFRERFDSSLIIAPRDQYIESSKLVQLFHLIKAFYNFRPSIVIVTTFGFHILFVSILSKLTRTPVVCIIHSLKKVSLDYRKESIFSLNFFRNSLFRNCLEKLLISISSTQIFPSNFFLKETISKGYKICNPKVIYHGIEKDFISNGPKQKTYSNIFSIVGGLLNVKGTDRINLILKSLPENSMLNWIGYDKLDRVQNMNDILTYKNPRFTIYEYANRYEFVSFLDKTVILLVPSYFESFSVVVLEACARGVPVILSDAVGIKELVEYYDSGIVDTFKSTEHLGNSIETILNNYNYYSTNAIKMASNSTWNKFIEDYIQIINSL
jgi:glycosyltransferase involved in cell wall biosynthesis